MLETRLTALLPCQIPIQQAPMGGVASSPELAIAVAEAGAVGMVASAGLPLEVLAPILDEVRGRTTGVFGVNFLIPFLERNCVELAASKARLLDFFYGDPDPSLVQLVHDGGALAGWQVGSVEEARAAEQAGCDVVVAQGVEAGGHVRGSLGLLPLLDGVLDAVQLPSSPPGASAPHARWQRRWRLERTACAWHALHRDARVGRTPGLHPGAVSSRP
jgi:NAD(P)H-dependent flavin oxidoreductase YrpB (nitropropane dioxygenase family)